MAAIFTEKAMRDRLAKNREEDAAIRAKTVDLRAERDKLVADIQPTENRIRELNKQIRKIEEPCFELANEHSRIVRALPGNRSVPAVDADEENARLNGKPAAVKKAIAK